MPDLKISQLAAGTTPLAGTELVPIVQSGVTSRTTVQAIMTSTVPSGTANGVLYLNGSKVATSGSALTFDGTNLGIGINPVSYLAKVATNGNLSLGTGGKLQLWDATDSTGTAIYNANNSSIWFGTQGGSEYMRLTSTGLGIGTSSPGYKLHVSGSQVTSMTQSTASSDAAVRTKTTLGDFGTGTGIGTATNCWNVYDYAVSAERMRLDSSGNLGLGVTPSAWQSAYKALEVGNSLAMMGGSNAADLYFNAFINSGGSFRYRANDPASAYSLAGGQHRWFTAPSGTAGTAITFTEAARITTANNQVLYQPAESAQNTSVTLTVANLQARIITSNAAVTLTLPTGTSLEGYTTSMVADTAFECTFIATTANAITIAANGNTTVGSLTVAGNTSGTFRFRKTAANTFTVYRVA